MAMRKEISIKWKGEEYKLLVTMEVIDELYDYINVDKLNYQVRNGDYRLPKIAGFIAFFLKKAGCKVTQEEIYESIHLGGSISPIDINPLLNMFFSAIFPEPEKK